DALVHVGWHVSSSGSVHTPTAMPVDQDQALLDLLRIHADFFAEMRLLGDAGTHFSGYEIYLAMKEIAEHPQDYPEAAAVLPGILSDLAGKILSDGGTGIEVSSEG
ncbi:hypothetical protein, partial [Escherichia coli]|uniref:hypothetical protein n=1 Tax=Escherichia coli TaxID=562 RepID=UPI00227FD90B